MIGSKLGRNERKSAKKKRISKVQGLNYIYSKVDFGPKTMIGDYTKSIRYN